MSNKKGERPALALLLVINAHVIGGMAYGHIGSLVGFSRSTIRRLETEGRRQVKKYFIYVRGIATIQELMPVGRSMPAWA